MTKKSQRIFKPKHDGDEVEIGRGHRHDKLSREDGKSRCCGASAFLPLSRFISTFFFSEQRLNDC